MKPNQPIAFEDIESVLAETIDKLQKRLITVKEANAITRAALALSRHHEHTQLKQRIEHIESIIKPNK